MLLVFYTMFNKKDYIMFLLLTSWFDKILPGRRGVLAPSMGEYPYFPKTHVGGVDPILSCTPSPNPPSSIRWGT